MMAGRLLRLLIPCLLWLPCAVSAADRVEIHVGRIEYAGAEMENFSATLAMDGRWQGRAALKQADLPRLAQAHPLPVGVSKGTARGKAVFAGEGTELRRLRLDAELRDIAFSDTEGLHAGEKVGGTMLVEVERSGGNWNWNGAIRWTEGEVFWQPLYLAQGGVSFRGNGRLADDLFTLAQGELAFAGIGEVALAGALHRPGNKLKSLELKARNLDAAVAYPRLIKPFLEKTLLGNLEMGGRVDVSASLNDGAVSAFDVTLRDFDVADMDNRFALYKVNARTPWALNHPTAVTLHYDGGHVLNIPLGTTDLAVTLNGYSLTAPVLRMSVLDGALTLKDVSAAFLQGRWHWHLGAALSPVSMADFSHAVGWPTMQGKMAASIPMVTYSNGKMVADGAMGLDVFDGSVVVRNLALQNPLGLAPRLQADIQMRELDLELLTRTYSFGAMTGRLDGDVKNLELSRWQPVKFDADFRSSPGRYPKKISQRAVENISALGGAGAAAAIQRSFLRFFKEFNYAKIGLSCKLRSGVCAMDGVEPAQSGYVIVKGSGIPAITVLGYNRSVSWGELLDRVRRITAGNASPVIK